MFDRQPSSLPRDAKVTMELTANYLISPQLTGLNRNCAIMLFLLTFSWVSPHLISSCAHS